MKEQLDTKIQTWSKLGQLFAALSIKKEWPGYEIGLSKEEYDSYFDVIYHAKILNPWFTEENTLLALSSWAKALEPQSLENWLSNYSFEEKKKSENIAIIMAGNIPLVGLHDLMSVVFSGHKALIKLSSDDQKMIPKILETLVHWEPNLKNQFEIITGRLAGFDRVIATGSNNTSRYFDHYFGKVPNIIRKNRTSIAILNGTETSEELAALGNDIFSYFGLGCRNVSKIYLPEGYSMETFFQGVFSFNEIVNHNKYANNYDYNKAVWLLNGDNLLDNGFLLLKESKELSAPTASLYFEYYADESTLNAQLLDQVDQIQCIVSRKHLPFGTAQSPGLLDYADGVDTMEFLLA